MAYQDIAEMALDVPLRLRVTACASTQDLDGTPPPSWVTDGRMWLLAGSPGWADAWASAGAGGGPGGDDRGSDPAVITDGMILSAVQALLAA